MLFNFFFKQIDIKVIHNYTPVSVPRWQFGIWAGIYKKFSKVSGDSQILKFLVGKQKLVDITVGEAKNCNNFKISGLVRNFTVFGKIPGMQYNISKVLGILLLLVGKKCLRDYQLG